VKKSKIINFGISLLFLWSTVFNNFYCYAQDTKEEQKSQVLVSNNQENPAKSVDAVVVPTSPIQEPVVQIELGEKPALDKPTISSENVTLDFNEADIRNVLKIISYKSGVNIVTTPDVIGNVTIRLVDVPWERALDVILKTYGFGYEKQGNIILVTKMENINKIQAEEPLKTEIFNLKFLDAQDAQRALIPLLSVRGKIAVLYTRGQKGWQFGSFKIGREQAASAALEQEKTAPMRSETVSIEKNPEGRTVSNKVDFETSVKSRTLIVTDTAASLDKIRNFVGIIDRKPKQVLIEARIIEVNLDKLKDIGFDWGTGTSGATGYTTPPSDLNINKGNKTIAARNLGSEFTPGKFNPIEGTTTYPGTYPYKQGLELIFKHLTGEKFEVIMHALEQNASSNTLSAPRILTLDNQEASILVGFHTPILSSTVTAASTSTGPTETQTLDYYQEIGIRLNVVPQISDEGFINMIIHPSVTSSSASVSAKNVAGTGTDAITSEIDYPIIDVREAQTQILMKDGETIVIGGLIKDVVNKEVNAIPFISKIPYVGNLFKRETIDKSKVDLLIFITAHVVKDDSFTPEIVSRLEESVGRGKEQGIETGKFLDRVAPPKKTAVQK